GEGRIGVLAPAPAAPAGASRPLLDLVEQGQAALHTLLAGTVLAEDLPRALDAARGGLRAVTLSGEVVDPDGTVTRRGTASGEAVLKRQQALQELEGQVRVAVAEQERAEHGHAGALAEQQAQAQRLRTLEDQARQLAGARQQRQNQGRELAHQAQSAQAQVDWLASLRAKAQEQAAAARQRELAIAQELASARASLPDLESAFKLAEEALAAWLVDAEQQAQRLAELRLQASLAGQRLQMERAQLAEHERQLQRAAQQLAERRERESQHSGAAATLEGEIAATARELATVSETLAQHAHQLAPFAQRLETLERERQALAQQQAAAREQQAELDKRCYRLGFDAQRAEEELQALAGTLQEELQLTPDVLPEPRVDEPEPSKREVDALRARIAALGPINPGALDEYQEVQDRHAFLVNQTADLDQAARQLQGVIAELEELTKRRFLETFELVSAEFQRYFHLMFGGGEVQMHLTDPDSVTTSGIEILAQPPGKRLQALPLLSGGERALVATGLLFAILSAKPVPFCLLDEVDAALDEANVRRFCQALAELAQRMQFLVITHNRETMAIADALYGVSMNQDGVSRLVSLRLPRGENVDGEIAPPPAAALAGRH
ncbi:MAG TPA: hypothetical protein VFS62_02605, partial [Chloroflexota bacterium]|nr:hypothetical protein [Chloroflexota bacterium]